jgi:hypothetical protein
MAFFMGDGRVITHQQASDMIEQGINPFAPTKQQKFTAWLMVLVALSPLFAWSVYLIDKFF